MQAKLTNRQNVAEGTTALEFVPLGDHLEFRPGQFFTLTLPVPVYTDNRGNSRHLGFSDLPDQMGTIHTAFRDGPSAFKRSLLEMPIGSNVDVSGVGGSLCLPGDSGSRAVMVVGGIGIVPIRSLLLQAKGFSFPNQITLIYSNTNAARAVFLSEFQSMADSHPSFRFIPVMTQDPGWQGETSRLDEHSLFRLIPDFSASQFFVTGTPRFVPDMIRHLKKLGVQMDRLKFEIFSGY